MIYNYFPLEITSLIISYTFTESQLISFLYLHRTNITIHTFLLKVFNVNIVQLSTILNNYVTNHSNNLSVLNLLITHKSDVNYNNGLILEHSIYINECKPIVSLLLENKSNILNSNLLINCTNESIIQLLIDYKLANYSNDDIIYLVKYDHLNILKLLKYNNVCLDENLIVKKALDYNKIHIFNYFCKY